MQNLPTYKKWISLFVVMLILFGFVTPVLADYLGPNRRVTTTVSTCHVTVYRCAQQDNGNWDYKGWEDWLCSNESKPWEAYSQNSPPCNSNNSGHKYWKRHEGTKVDVIDYPPATITGSIVDCTLQSGWCRGGTVPQLVLSANEPLAGQTITLIEGTLNSTSFSCNSGVTNCSVLLGEGDNNFNYWALSSWGDSSTMGTSSARVDTVPPNVEMDVLGTRGTNGWYISPTTVTATGSDNTSGVASALLSVDRLTWQPAVTLNEGVYNLMVYVIDNAGNEAQSPAVFAVDTTTPAIAVSISGTAGKNGWYRSAVQISAAPTDATSGIATFEVSADGVAYQAYTAPIIFQDGYHTIRFKAMDQAGNQTETPLQEFRVDSLTPTVDLPASWQLGRNVPYSVLDEGSGLAALRIVIEDEDERYAKVAWNQQVSGPTYSQDIDWNGEFKDKTVAPPGTYLVWIKASDVAGNERFQLGKVIVPEPNLFVSLLPTEEPMISATTPVPPAELSDPALDSPATLPPTFGFGGETGELTEPADTTTQSVVLTSAKTTGSDSTTSTGILWGAAAAAAIAAATTYAIETTRKRKEAEAEQAAQVKADVSQDKAERAEKKQKQKENWAEQQAQQTPIRNATASQIEKIKNSATAPPSGISPEAQQAFLHGGGTGAQKWIKKNLQQLQQAYLKQQADAKEANRKREEAKRRAEEEARKAAELQAKLSNYYNAEKQRSTNFVKTEKSWTDKVWVWFDQHQTEIALGLGAAIGIAAILLSGGLAAPLVAVAWTAGAAATAAGIAAAGTVILNNHFDREWHVNLFNNVTDAVFAATVVTGGWFLLQKAMLVGGALCANHPAQCSAVQPVLNAWDAGEEIWLSAKMTYYSWKGDEQKAAELAFDLHSEYADGGMPGNVAVKEFTDRLADIGEVVGKYGKNATKLIKKHGLPAINLLKIVDPNDAGKLLDTFNDDVLYNVIQEGPDAVAALSRWDIDDLSKHGLELASRAKRDAKALAAVQKLVASGPIDPKNLTKEQQTLINEIAANSTQYADEGQVVLGKWVDYSSGFVEYAKDTASVHYNPHPDMWNLLGKLGPEKQDNVAWLINRQVVQTGIDKGLPFEYTLNGIPVENLVTEGTAIEAIFAGATDTEIMDILSLDYVPIRMKELQELQKAGYDFALDESINSYILVMP